MERRGPPGKMLMAVKNGKRNGIIRNLLEIVGEGKRIAEIEDSVIRD